MEQESRPIITDIRLLQLRTIRAVGTLEPAWDLGGRLEFSEGGGTVVEIETDSGQVGIGPGFDPALLPVVRHHLVGQDPFETERHQDVLRYYARSLPYRGRAGVDIALWDLIGKICGQPLYKLWGGGKEKVAAYASMVRLSTAAERAELAARLSAEGWQAIKLRLHCATMREDLAIVEQVRTAVGDTMQIMVDANQAQSTEDWQPGVTWDYRRALETAIELDALGCYWLEEPLPRYAYGNIARINESVAMPIAGGENNIGIHEFVQMLEQNVYDILQPEGMVGGGLTELRKIGVLAAAYGKQIVPHHGGRGLGTVAHLHLVASWRHSQYLEVINDPPVGAYQYGYSILENPPIVDSEGFVAVPQQPGLGVTLRRDLVSETITA